MSPSPTRSQRKSPARTGLPPDQERGTHASRCPHGRRHRPPRRRRTHAATSACCYRCRWRCRDGPTWANPAIAVLPTPQEPMTAVVSSRLTAPFLRPRPGGDRPQPSSLATAGPVAGIHYGTLCFQSSAGHDGSAPRLRRRWHCRCAVDRDEDLTRYWTAGSGDCLWPWDRLSAVHQLAAQ